MRWWMLISTVVYFSILLATDQKEYELILKFEKGEKLYYQSQNKNDTKTLQGGNMSTTVSVIEHRIEKVEEETVELNADILKLKYRGNDGQYDSGKKKTSLPQERVSTFNSLLEEELRVKVTPNGEIKKTEGEEELKKTIVGNIQNDPMMKMLPKDSQERLAESIIRNAYGLFLFQFLPKRKVSVGDTWTIEQEQPLMKLVWEVKLKSVKKRRKKQIATMILRLKDVSLQRAGTGKRNPLSGMMEISKKEGTGEIEFNITDGRTTSFKMSFYCCIKSRMNRIVVSESRVQTTTKLLKKPPKLKK